MWWFLLAFVLLVAVLILLRLDAAKRSGSAPRDRAPEVDDGGHGSSSGSDDDEVGRAAPVSDPGAAQPGPSEAGTTSGAPQPAPFQIGTAAEREHMESTAEATGLADESPEPTELGESGESGAAAEGVAAADGSDGAADDGAADDGVVADSALADNTLTDHGDAADEDAPDEDPAAALDSADSAEEPGGSVALPAAAAGAGLAGLAGAAGAPKLTDRLRKFLHGRKPNRGPVAQPQPEHEDPLADSPVVRWLEEREFAPTPTPAPDFRHGDFAGGLPALGAVSHGMFRGRRALMGVAGGRAVLALQRDTVSDVVLDLSRPDVDAEPGFHDAGEVAALEARTSDYGRLELIDRDRLAEAVRDLPSDVRRVWAESEWLAATVDSAGNPATWDDTVAALYEAADVLAPLPPVGGRARPLPTEIDPGSPGAASGPDADPSGGIPEPASWHSPQDETPVSDTADPKSAADELGDSDSDEIDALGDTYSDESGDGADVDPEVMDAGPVPADAGPVSADMSRRTGHLRLVPDRSGGVRDLSDEPVVADRGDTLDADESVDAVEPVEPDPFAEIMEPTGPAPSRGDVAADHLESRPPLARPSRGAGHTYPEDASVPPLAAGATSSGAGIKPLGSEDDEDEIRTEVERFDAARIDGGSDLDADASGRHSSGRHAGRHEGEVPAWLRSELATPREGGRRRRRAEPEPGSDTDPDAADTLAADADPHGTERPGAEPDVERTLRIQLPPDIDD